jgi:hypothetical protein
VGRGKRFDIPDPMQPRTVSAVEQDQGSAGAKFAPAHDASIIFYQVALANAVEMLDRV